VKDTADAGVLREWIATSKRGGKRIGFVPTMGYLHEGHLSLVDLAAKRSDTVVMSIFVNPTQFGPDEDFNRYPRDISHDMDLASRRGVEIVFRPEVEVVYPDGEPLTYVDMHRIPTTLCGASRPGHFRGVMTVVAKLLNLVDPDVAVFGQKDIQQLIVIERMVRDLNFPVEIVSGPIVREEDGLAMSSRNSYLSDDERRDARLLYRSLQAAKKRIDRGERESRPVIREMENVLQGETIRIDYVSIVRYHDLRELDRIDGKVIVAVAAFAGNTRLIDNMLVEITDDGIVFSA
jgi:pantoate--beta-alanine ligase